MATPLSPGRGAAGGPPTGAGHLAPLSPSMTKFRNAAIRATAFNKRKEKPKKEDNILPVEVTLGKTRLVFSEHGWKLDPAVVSQYEKKIEELTRQIGEVQKKAEKWEKDSRSAKNGGERLVEEANMFKFKNQLLIEMLAIAQLDETQAVHNYQREKLKADEYRAELERCYARMLTLGLDPSINTTTTSLGSTATLINTTTTTQKVLDMSMSSSLASTGSMNNGPGSHHHHHLSSGIK